MAPRVRFVLPRGNECPQPEDVTSPSGEVSPPPASPAEELAAASVIQSDPVAAGIPDPLTAAEMLGHLAAVEMPEGPPPRSSITSFMAINRSVSPFVTDPVEDLLAETDIAPELRRDRFVPPPGQPFSAVLATAQAGFSDSTAAPKGLSKRKRTRPVAGPAATAEPRVAPARAAKRPRRRSAGRVEVASIREKEERVAMLEMEQAKNDVYLAQKYVDLAQARRRLIDLQLRTARRELEQDRERERESSG
ncbi:hypothetical protein DTO027B5_5081 [Paecilomyces variotii]|nr:hypothetical protein DTO169C6_5566 [Paecilomyces variotii]KAJ9291947.1 hypothetical protein DTO021C3_387 [Paecilomyces variotii]KAJ9322600.1 hypothetical protein DTO027B3_6370 [Paecilomyces variotii]KAJ9333173.1 hypothetical protein DTO027B5_5081 [Paecilomyces variotii]KAJ9396153.1 hypothetical protein DTO282F9_6996 [Paecilomyces variotii]